MNRVAVVTGAARGIGAATVALLTEGGWDVVGLDIAPPSGDQWRQVDVGDPDALTAALADVDRVDGLVNNAAMQLFKPLIETTVEEWDAVLDQNLRGAFVCMKYLHSRLAMSHGAIVNVASVHALATSGSIAAYAASKGGLVALTRAAALEFASDGVRANAVLPGAIDTPALRAGFERSEGAERALVERTPLKRIGEPRDVAETIRFLLEADRSAFVTGQTFVIDGGALARLSTE